MCDGQEKNMLLLAANSYRRYLQSEILIWRFCAGDRNFSLRHDNESRSQVIGDMESILPHLDDPDMEELSNRVIGKLRNMTDEEFEQLELIEAE